MDFNQIKEELARSKSENLLKDEKIKDLQSVIDKLRAVLDQSSPLTVSKQNSSLNYGNSLKEKFFKRSKKHGVSAEAWTPTKMVEPVHHKKDSTARTLIKNALLKNHLLQHLEQSQITEIVECMYEKKIIANANVIEEGSEANNLYVIQSGQFGVYREKTKISDLKKETAFGELALLYNCKRTATVKACVDSVVWVIDRPLFRTIMRKTYSKRHAELQSFLKNVPILKDITEANFTKLADLLEMQVYAKKECILKQGETANCFFIIQSGSAIVTQKIPNSDQEKECRTLIPGDFFGEKALLSGGLRTASVYSAEHNTEILCLYRSGFLELMGDLSAIKSINYRDEERFQDIQRQTPTSPAAIVDDDAYGSVALADIQRLKTLGVGGFGRVFLVKLKGVDHHSFALKCMKKEHILKMKQQTHVLSEKQILSELRSTFICRLYQTYKDTKYVYLLMEICLGGELWSVLRDRAFFDDYTTRFCLSCVVEAFEYLHGKGIIYRDLKPENLLISGENGYLKLCDFGFAKKLGYGKKTWTFCGTPEYVAPEIILNKSHDASADLWSLGILTYELLNGMPPFSATEPMKIYSMILKGLESIDLTHNKKLSPKAISFITQLCCKSPPERLGNGKNGYQDIKSHKYFQGFEWDKLRKMKLKSPFAPKVKDPFDGSNFDSYPEELENAAEENSGWDANF